VGDADLVKVFLRGRAGDVESVWCSVVDAARGLYRIASVPFLREKPTYADVVVATPDRDGALTLRRVHSPGGFRPVVLEYAKKATFRPLVAWLRAEHAAVAEGCMAPRTGHPGLLVVAIPARARVESVVAAATARFPGLWRHGERPEEAPGATDDREARLHAAIVAGDLAAVRRAIAAGAKLERRLGEGGSTALILASGTKGAKRVAVVRALLEAGAKVDGRNDFKQTAAFLAIRRGDASMLAVLRRAGADVLARDEEGATAMFRAVTEGHTPMVKMLLAAGADPNERSRRFRGRPLHGAATRDRPDIAKLLLAAGARVDVRDHADFTPLMCAAYRGSTATARVLLPRTRPQDRNEALLLAAVEGDLSVVKLLVAAGADVTYRSELGNTALSLARKRKRAAVVAFLARTL